MIDHHGIIAPVVVDVVEFGGTSNDAARMTAYPV
jgi:hypothetical protein